MAMLSGTRALSWSSARPFGMVYIAPANLALFLAAPVRDVPAVPPAKEVNTNKGAEKHPVFAINPNRWNRVLTFSVSPALNNTKARSPKFRASRDVAAAKTVQAYRFPNSSELRALCVLCG